jgi:hypothetical protein
MENKAYNYKMFRWYFVCLFGLLMLAMGLLESNNLSIITGAFLLLIVLLFYKKFLNTIRMMIEIRGKDKFIADQLTSVLIFVLVYIVLFVIFG